MTDEDLRVDRWRALALWQTGQWEDGRYADYLEGRPEHDPTEPMEAALIARLRGETPDPFPDPGTTTGAP